MKLRCYVGNNLAFHLINVCRDAFAVGFDQVGPRDLQTARCTSESCVFIVFVVLELRIAAGGAHQRDRSVIFIGVSHIFFKTTQNWARFT